MTFLNEDLKEWEAELDDLARQDPHAVLLGPNFLPGMRALIAAIKAADALAKTVEAFGLAREYDQLNNRSGSFVTEGAEKKMKEALAVYQTIRRMK